MASNIIGLISWLLPASAFVKLGKELWELWLLAYKGCSQDRCAVTSSLAEKESLVNVCVGANIYSCEVGSMFADVPTFVHSSTWVLMLQPKKNNSKQMYLRSAMKPACAVEPRRDHPAIESRLHTSPDSLLGHSEEPMKCDSTSLF